jgi:hypothetical protein
LGSYVGTDGQQREAVDVWFATSPAAASAPSAADVLADAPATLLPGSDAAAQAGSGSSGASGPVQASGGLTIDEEWLKNQPPLI